MCKIKELAKAVMAVGISMAMYTPAYASDGGMGESLKESLVFISANALASMIAILVFIFFVFGLNLKSVVRDFASSIMGHPKKKEAKENNMVECQSTDKKGE